MFNDELLKQPLPEPKYKNEVVLASDDEENDAPSASTFKQSEQDFKLSQQDQDSFNKKQEKLQKKNQNLQQLRNKQQKETSKKQKEISKKHKETSKKQQENTNKNEITLNKLKAFEQQLIKMQEKSDKNRNLALDEEEEEIEELDSAFLESLSAETEPVVVSSAKAKKTVFKDEENTRPNYSSIRDDYNQQEASKKTTRVSKLKQLREAKNKTQRVKTNGVLIEKVSSTTGRQAIKNSKLENLRKRLLK